MITALAVRTYPPRNGGPVDREMAAVDLPVTGRLPKELAGRHLRIGPSPIPGAHVCPGRRRRPHRPREGRRGR